MKDGQTRVFLFEYGGRSTYFQYQLIELQGALSAYLLKWDDEAGYNFCRSLLDLHFLKGSIKIKVLGK